MDNKYFTLRWINMFFIVSLMFAVMATLFTNNRDATAQVSFSFSIPALSLAGAHGIAIDGSDNIYIATRTNVVKLDNTGALVTVFGSFGSGDGQFRSPRGIALDRAGNIFVVDSGNHLVQKFDSHGNFLFAFGTFGSDDGQFSDPRGIALDSTGNIFVADRLNHRVQAFDERGNFLFTFGTDGADDGQFRSPHSIALDSAGNIFVADSGNDRMQKFDAHGNFLFKFSVPGGSGGYPGIIIGGIAFDNTDNIFRLIHLAVR